VSPVIEEQAREIDGQTIPIDATGPNPNGEEFDNLYLDMNGIVHPCSHPEDRPPPQNEEEMMMEVFKYTERVVNMVRPRKLLMIAVGMCDLHLMLHNIHSNGFVLISYHRWCGSSCQDESATISTIPISSRS
jgi:hypothetical protein